MAQLSRRQFLQTASMATAAAAPIIVPRQVLGGDGIVSPNERVTLGGIGIGGIGHPQLKDAQKAGFEIVALCDIDQLHAEKTYKFFPQARKYVDFRELISSEDDKVDAIYCGTPDHTHAIITLAALRAKKHVCCVKPLTRTIEECEVVCQTALEAKTATQVTMSPNTSETACRVRELIDAGAIGEIREVHLWSMRPVWPQGMVDYPTFSDTPADTFDWDKWLGPAEKRPYTKQWPAESPYPEMCPAAWGGRNVYHPFNFRGWTEFGTGSLGDMGCHYANTPYKAFGLQYPTRITSSSTKKYKASYPLSCMVTYDYPASDKYPAIRMIWYDGGLKPAAPKVIGSEKLPNEGVLYVGTEGAMLFDRILDPERAEKFKDVPKTLPRRGGVMPEWFEACRGGEPASANFAYAGPVTQFVLLGNLALQTGNAIELDPVSHKILNNPEAQALVSQPYHNGWTL